ncbi:MAG: hypothetical protein Q9162_007468 [Coniocarpon cinnabarinum]
MSPRIENSIKQISPISWEFGSSMIVEKTNLMPSDAQGSWAADASGFFVLRPALFYSPELSPQPPAGPHLQQIHQAGTSSSVWRLGAAIIKVRSWVHGMEIESDTIDILKEKSSVPVPTVICAWPDIDYDRSFVILKPIAGRTLSQAWPLLLNDQRRAVAKTVAGMCAELAKILSIQIETPKGSGVLEPLLHRKAPFDHPSWKPHLLGPLLASQLERFLRSFGNIAYSEHIEWYEPFRFMHGNLGPTNIMVDGSGNVTCIVNWEGAGYYPRFWVGTKPRVSSVYLLDPEISPARTEWRDLLSQALSELGFSEDLNKYAQWQRALGVKT